MRTILSAILLSGCLLASPQKPDDSKSNKTDRQNNAPTAEDQSNAPADIELTRRIRRTITKQDNFSQYAKNVKIITRTGSVLLRGPVESAEEKSAIEEIARREAGDGKVTSELEIVAKK